MPSRRRSSRLDGDGPTGGACRPASITILVNNHAIADDDDDDESDDDDDDNDEHDDIRRRHSMWSAPGRLW